MEASASMKITGERVTLSGETAMREKLFHLTNCSFARAFPLAYLTSMMWYFAL